jgi:hypothetical protein
MIRRAAVAGQFYPGNPAELRRLIEKLADPKAKKEPAVAVVSPHAGYVYSGRVAGAVFSSVVLPATFVIVAPAHRPIRPVFALMTEGSWETPLGEVPIDAELAEGIQSRCRIAVSDPAAHAAEHSLEVQIPFLQVLRGDIAIVPINVSSRAVEGQLDDLGRAIAGAVRACGKEVLLVASTDMSHYLSASEARAKDVQAIDRILALDARGLIDVVRSRDISMCGVLPTAAVITAAKEGGATRAELVRYATSGEVTGDEGEVVAYAGLRIL